MVAPQGQQQQQPPQQPQFRGEDGSDTRMRFAPRGQWRHGLCGCCKDKCACGLCCCACWCTPIVQAQLLTRMRLDFLGEPAHTDEQAKNTFWIVLTVFLLAMFGNGILPAIAGFLFFVYSIVYATRLRNAMRRRYGIPGSCCNRKRGGGNDCCDDCCCTCCCPCCTAIQMARHTHPDTYDCATPDGIPKAF